jgi:hypothetical protein
MCRCQIEGKNFNLELNVTPQADFLGCLLGAVIAALPAFLEAFMTCLAGGGATGGYKPGDRERCT